jgi:hypothetical protein
MKNAVHRKPYLEFQLNLHHFMDTSGGHEIGSVSQCVAKSGSAGCSGGRV